MAIQTPFGSFGVICRMVKIEHSIFALPYAWAGAVLAAGGMPPWPSLIFLTLAMVAVRSFAMAFNRLVDLPFDRKNPRTANRPLVTGEVSITQTWAFCVVMAILFIACCAAINPLCLILSVPALLFSGAYSLVKRFSWLCHFWLGATLGLAPLAGWISVTPAITLTPVLFFLAVAFWLPGFDILYSCQDVEFDRSEHLFSMPACFGIDNALHIAAFSHVMTSLFLLLGGWSAGLSVWWYVMWLGVSVLLLWEHRLVSAKDLSRVNMAFFTVNGIISPVILLGVIAGIYW